MKYAKHQEGWYAMATTKELRRKKPVRRFLLGTPIVLFQGANGPAAMTDRCPHRGAALSEGCVKDGNIQCPYHGWTFSEDGALNEIPCLPGDSPPVKVQSFKTCIQFGLIFVCLGDGPDSPYKNPLSSSVKFWRAMRGGANCSLVEAAENFLDPTHTVFVHKQLFYNVKNKTPTRVIGHGDDNMAEINYYGEGDAGGLIGKIMGEKERSKSVGRFIAPNIAEVEFHGPKGVNFITTGFITPARDGTVEGYGVIGLPGPLWWAWIKYIFLYPWIRLVYGQDRTALGSLTKNRAHFPGHKNIIGPLDVMRRQIEAITSGRPPPAKDKPFETEMHL